MRRFVLLITAIMLAGCATKYGEMGIFSGASAEKVSPDVYRVKARGNGYTTMASVRDFILLKSAETTLEAGGTHFTIAEAADRTMTLTYNSGAQIRYPTLEATMRIVRLKPGESAPRDALSARDIVQKLGPKLKAS